MATDDFPIIEKLGGRKIVVERLRNVGLARVSEAAARMWQDRGRLPGHVTQMLMSFADQDNISYSGADFAPGGQDSQDEQAA